MDVGGLSSVSQSGSLFARNVYGIPINGGISQPILGQHSLSPRVGTGVGVSWRTPFGLINIDLAEPVVKKKYDQTQFFRFGFGTRF